MDATLEELDGLFDDGGRQPTALREAPEPEEPSDDDLAVGDDLFPPRASGDITPGAAAAPAVDADDSLPPHHQQPQRPPDPVVAALATEDLTDLFEPAPAPVTEPMIDVIQAQEVEVASEEPPQKDAVPADEAPEGGDSLEAGVLTLAAGLRRLADELSDFSADPS